VARLTRFRYGGGGGRSETDVGVLLHHVNICARDLKATIAFYVDAIGLTEGARPPFGFPGAWLYDGARAAVHLNLVGEEPDSARAALDHVAFAYDALDPVLERLHGLGLRATPPTTVPGTAIRQCFVKDPNGVTVELQGP
jgi:catechol 2,3-dioxygenase-like lactoylglutathione lyase family enzyme